jgi:DNA-binding NtrC family response regulator
MELMMYHVMLVVSDDDFCLFLASAICLTACRMTIVGSVAEATAALAGRDSVDQVITEAFLPDGSGFVLAQDVRRMGKPAFVLRERRGQIVVYDREASVFAGDQIAVAEFLAKSVSETAQRCRSARDDAAMPAPQAAGRHHR